MNIIESNLYQFYRSLVENMGFDGSGTNCGDVAIYTSHLYAGRLAVDHLPIEENAEARAAIARYYRRTNSFRAKAVRRIKREWRRLWGQAVREREQHAHGEWG